MLYFGWNKGNLWTGKFITLFKNVMICIKIQYFTKWNNFNLIFLAWNFFLDFFHSGLVCIYCLLCKQKFNWKTFCRISIALSTCTWMCWKDCTRTKFIPLCFSSSSSPSNRLRKSRIRDTWWRKYHRKMPKICLKVHRVSKLTISPTFQVNK